MLTDSTVVEPIDTRLWVLPVPRVLVVDKHAVSTNAVRQPMGLGDIVGPDVEYLGKIQITGQPKCVDFTAERNQAHHWTEYFLPRTVHLALDVSKHRRLNELALLQARREVGWTLNTAR